MQALLLRVAQGVGCTAGGTGVPGNTARETVHQMTVAGQKGVIRSQISSKNGIVKQ